METPSRDRPTRRNGRPAGSRQKAPVVSLRQYARALKGVVSRAREGSAEDQRCLVLAVDFKPVVPIHGLLDGTPQETARYVGRDRMPADWWRSWMGIEPEPPEAA